MIMGSINEFLIQIYFGQLYSGIGKKMYSKSISLAMALAESNEKSRELAKLKYIYDNTTDWMKVPMPILEHMIDKQYLRKISVPKMKRERINGRIIPHYKIIKALSDAYIEITMVVTKIAKDLNIEIEFDMSKYPVDRE